MIVIDYKDRRPIYEQVVERFQDLIVKGVIRAGEQMPSVRSLAMELAINPNTIQKAYAELERRGFTYTVKGRGSFVSAREEFLEYTQKEVLESFRNDVDDAKNLQIAKNVLTDIIDRCYEGADGLPKKGQPPKGKDAPIKEKGLSGKAGDSVKEDRFSGETDDSMKEEQLPEEKEVSAEPEQPPEEEREQSMIEAKQVSKYYEDIKALDQVSVTINEGNVFGLVGTNGAGKSTFMRILSGVLKADQGEITIDGHPVYENMEAKSQVFYISDDQYFFPSGTPADMEVYYRVVYPRFDHDRFVKMMAQFDLDKKRKLRTFSKGMKKQVSILLGICANTKYLFCDETFDGLDPVMRQAVKSLFAQEMTKRGMTPIIASHNLRELEDICDHVGLLHKGGILFAKDLEEMKIYIHKIQCVFREEGDAERAFEGLEILQQEQRGSLYTVTARGTREGILQKIQETDPLFAEVLPLSLEEIFISETEVAGYDIKKLVF